MSAGPSRGRGTGAHPPHQQYEQHQGPAPGHRHHHHQPHYYDHQQHHYGPPPQQQQYRSHAQQQYGHHGHHHHHQGAPMYQQQQQHGGYRPAPHHPQAYQQGPRQQYYQQQHQHHDGPYQQHPGDQQYQVQHHHHHQHHHYQHHHHQHHHHDQHRPFPQQQQQPVLSDVHHHHQHHPPQPQQHQPHHHHHHHHHVQGGGPFRGFRGGPRGGGGGYRGGAGGRGGRGRGNAAVSSLEMPKLRTPDPAAKEAFMAQYREASAAGLQAQKVGIVGSLDVDAALRVIDSNDVSFITTDTGTGKSTRIPQALLARGDRVVVAEPRRQAAISLAERVMSVRGDERLGEHVGYRIRGDAVGTSDTPLMYMTSYTLLLWLLSHPEDTGYTHIIIDEFHERQSDVEVTVALLRVALERVKSNAPDKPKPFKLIFMSATAEMERWRNYFSRSTVGEYSTIVERHPVHQMMQEDFLPLLGFNSTTDFEVSEGSATRQIPAAMFYVKCLLCFLAEVTQPHDSILVFVPGRAHIEMLVQSIDAHLGERMEAIPWYRDVDVKDLQRALAEPGQTRTKVFIATDIAEVSITLAHLTFVIDMAMTRKPRIDARAVGNVAFPPLDTFWAPEFSQHQRRGRVGRVKPGFYISVLRNEDTPKVSKMTPPIENQRVDELTLHLLQSTDDPTRLLSLCFAAPTAPALWLSRRVLQDLGLVVRLDNPFASNEIETVAVSEKWRQWVVVATEHLVKVAEAHAESGTKYPKDSREGQQLALAHRLRKVESVGMATTVRGRIVQFLPFSLQPSVLVWYGLIFGLESAAVVLAAVASIGTPFYAPTAEKAEERHREVVKTSEAIKRFMIDDLSSDLIASGNAVVQYLQRANDTEAEIDTWCESNRLDRVRLDAVKDLVVQAQEQLHEHISFVQVQDPAKLKEQLLENAILLNALAVGAYATNAILLTAENAAEAQRFRKAGHGVFLDFDALRDNDVATCTEWPKGAVAVPLIMQRRSNTLFGHFNIVLPRADFCFIMALVSHEVVVHEQIEWTEGEDDTWDGVSFSLLSQRRGIAMAHEVRDQVVYLRELSALRHAVQGVMLRNHIKIDDTEAIADAMAKLDLPSIAGARCPAAADISTALRQGAVKILRSATGDGEASELFKAVPVAVLDEAPDAWVSTTFCATNHKQQYAAPRDGPLPPPEDLPIEDEATPIVDDE